MAETLVSPGVLQRENDQSFIQGQPVSVGAAIVGPAVKGPVEVPTIVTSYSDYQNRFGTTFESGSDEYTYFTSIAAYNYFNNGGESLLVTRVVSGSSDTDWDYASADVAAVGESGVLDITADALLSSITTNPTDCDDATYTAVDLDGGTGTGAQATVVCSGNTITGITITNAGTGYVIGDTLTIAALDLGVASSAASILLDAGDLVNEVAFTLEVLDKGELFNNNSTILSNNSLTDGTSNNIRWEIATSNSNTGTFSLIIRRGDDDENNKVILETWNNLSLDPKAPNYIAKVIGDQKFVYDQTDNYLKLEGNNRNASRYVRVASVTNKTPNYFDNAGNPKSIYANKLPLVGSGSAGGAFNGGEGSNIPVGIGYYYDAIISGVSNTQGLVDGDYTRALNLLANQDDYKFNILLTPGLNDVDNASPISTAINNTQMRGDSIYVVDLVPYGDSITTAIGNAGDRDTSYAAAYWPWCLVSDPDTGAQVWVPASTLIGGVYAFNDRSSEPWFAPAGINRGGLTNVIRPERKLTASNRDDLYEANVNPIASFPGTGVVVYGQKTLQKRASALDRVNVRRLLIELKNYIGQVSQTLVFEQNTAATRNNFLAQVNPYLESVVQRSGLYAFKVVMDDSNNTPDVIDRNQMVGQIFLQPTKTAEFIILDFNVLPTGATFPA